MTPQIPIYPNPYECYTTIKRNEVISMIYAYPPNRALDSYQTHKDYYRVSAVSRVSGGKSITIRRPLDMPFEELAYKQFAQSAAKGVAGFVQNAQSVKRSAQTLVESRLHAIAQPTTPLSKEASSESIIEPIRQFVDTYNDFQDNLRESPEYLNHSLLLGLEQAAKPYSLKDIGISQQQLPSASLFQMSRSALQPYGQYRSQLQAYLPVPMSGLLLDLQM